MKPNDGGPAFPFTPHPQPCIDGKWDQSYAPGDSGMTLRDYFAAAALTGMLASGNFTGFTQESNAPVAWRYADAMLAEREKEKPDVS